MIRTSNTVNAIASIFCEATKEVLEAGTGKEITYARTIQKIPVIHLRPEIGCFVLFNGDYSGLMIMNFTSEAAMAIYRNYMIHMGLPEEELATDFTADEVVDNIGEMINQIIGKVRRRIEEQYGLAASNTQPKAIALTTSIILTIDAQEVDKELCRRLAFKIEGHSFHIELSLEKTEFVAIDGSDVHSKSKEYIEHKHHVDLDSYSGTKGAGAQAASDDPFAAAQQAAAADPFAAAQAAAADPFAAAQAAAADPFAAAQAAADEAPADPFAAAQAAAAEEAPADPFAAAQAAAAEEAPADPFEAAAAAAKADDAGPVDPFEAAAAAAKTEKEK